MNWDWDKLKEHQQQHGGTPPQLDELFNKFKDIKLPGGPILIGVIVLALISLSCFFTVAVDEEAACCDLPQATINDESKTTMKKTIILRTNMVCSFLL